MNCGCNCGNFEPRERHTVVVRATQKNSLSESRFEFFVPTRGMLAGKVEEAREKIEKLLQEADNRPKEIEAGYFGSRCPTTFEQVAESTCCGWRQAGLRDIIDFGEQNQDIIKSYIVVGLGTRIEIDNQIYVPCILKKKLWLMPWEGWVESLTHVYLVVKNKKSGCGCSGKCTGCDGRCH